MAEDGDPDHDPAMIETDEVPTHVRTVELRVYERPDVFVVVAGLQDHRPWAAGTSKVENVHHMALTVTVRRSDLTIVAAEAEMLRFPHVECRQIEEAFCGLVGLSVARGYTRAVQDRFGRTLGCTHLEFLARSIGPAVVQAVTSSGARAAVVGLGGPGVGSGNVGAGTNWVADSCHVWAVGGVGEQKLALGWRPGLSEYPAPTVVELRRRKTMDAP